MYSYFEPERRGGRQWLGVAAAVILVCASISGLWLWRSQQVRILSVQSGSMAPSLQPGDAVVVRQVPVAGIHPGDVISFHDASDGTVVTHRVVDTDLENGRLYTQGDANASPDEPLDAGQVVGKAERRIVNAGHVIDFLHSRAGLVVCVYMPAILLVSREFRRLASYYQPPYKHVLKS